MEHNWDSIRNDFPILATHRNGKSLVYLDSAATSQKPQCVLDEIDRLYREYNANIHRGVYHLSEETSKAYLQSKEKVAAFINAASYQNIIYTRNATDALNMAARMLEERLSDGDEILISMMEHHSNMLPWRKLAERKRCMVKYIPLTDEGEIDMDAFETMVTDKTKILAIGHASNVLGTINPLEQMIQLIHLHGGVVVADGSQAVGSITVDVESLDADMYAFTGHKVFGPTGIGVLYAKQTLLEECEPVSFGGDMVEYVDLDNMKYKELPWKFEAGTSNYEGGIALGYALDYLHTIGIEGIYMRKTQLREYLEERLKDVAGVRMYGTSKEKVGIVSFTFDGIHPHDIASILDQQNICIRAGNHCAQPLIDYYQCNAMARVSLHMYNNEDDIDRLITGLKHVKEVLGHG